MKKTLNPERTTGFDPVRGGCAVAATSLSAWVDAALQDRELCGRVHSCFARAVNLIDSQGRLFCLAEEEGGMLPFGVLLAPGPERSRLFAAFSPGMKVALSRDAIDVEEGAARIDFAGAAIAEHRRGTGRETPPDRRRLKDLLRRVNTATGRRGHGFRIESFGKIDADEAGSRERDPFGTALLLLLRRGLDAVRCGRAEEAADEFLTMTGIGVGLTPSGDDLLVGMLAALDACREQPQAGHFYRNLARGLYRLPREATTDIARAYLLHAVQGRFAERVLDCRNAFLAGGGGTGLDNALERLLDLGAASGGETALGVLIGFYCISQGAPAAIPRTSGDCKGRMRRIEA